MKCSRCGWDMRQIDSRNYSNYYDYLYSCRCGNTQLQVFPIINEELKAKIPLNIRLQNNEKALTK